MKFTEYLKKEPIVPKKVPNAYSGGMTWAAVRLGLYGDEVLESGFSLKKDVVAWIKKNSAPS